MKSLIEIGKKSKIAFEKLKVVDHKKIKKVLHIFSSKILKSKKQILRENQKDLKKVKRHSLVDRLVLNEKRIEGIRYSINEISKFQNPIGKSLMEWKRPNGLKIKKISTPIGVIGVIYESRPNVTADVAALCLKSGNCSILRGGSEAYNSNLILANLFRDSLKMTNFDINCAQFIKSKDRKVVDYMLSKMSKFIDVIVPRGGKGLVAKVQKASNVHVIGHLEGLCHIYLDEKSNLNYAKKIILNSKMRRTSICGALETLIVNKKIINSHVKPIINDLIKRGCEIRVDDETNRYFDFKLKKAKEKDWKTEYLDSILSIKTVKNVDEAIDHVIKYGTMHTDGIITDSKKNAEKFLKNINSSIAVHNVSTQFADGGEFGFGGEIGISTNKMPPRGPVGINQLTSYKYIVSGKGITRP